MLLKNKGYLCGRSCRVHRCRNWVFEALKETKFFLPQSEMIERSKVKLSVASFLDVSWLSLKGCGIVQSGVIGTGVDRTVCQGKKIIDK